MGVFPMLSLVIVSGLVIAFPVYFLYKTGEQKGRLKELRRQQEEKASAQQGNDPGTAQT